MALCLGQQRGACSSSGSQRAQQQRPRVAARRPLAARAALTAEKASMDIKKMEPLHDRVLIKPIEEEPKTAAGILLPKGPPKSNSDAHFGEVLAVGSEVKLALAAGDKVIFNKYAMAEVEVPDGDIIFVAEKSILAKLE
ncbi:groS [Scenedesmus sp. PABB004]|nr:groS [Scenedesmus sp. PABB004]